MSGLSSTRDLESNSRHVTKTGLCQYCTCTHSHSHSLKLNFLDTQKVSRIQAASIHSKTEEDSRMGDGSECENDSDSDNHIRPALDAHTPIKPSPHYVNIVPGKGPPPEPPVDCCMSGCANCVWIQYAEELKKYFSESEGNAIMIEALEQIENPGLKMFLKMELGLLN